MKKTQIHIFSKKPSILHINGCAAGVIDHVKTHSIDLEVYTSSLVFTLQELSTGTFTPIPYSARVDFSGETPFSVSEFIKIVPFPKNRYYLVFPHLPASAASALTVQYSEKVGKYNVIIYNGENSIINIYENSILRCSVTTKKLEAAESTINHNHLVIKGVLNGNYTFLLVLNISSNQIVFEGECSSLEETETSIKVLQPVYDIARHGKVTEISLNSGSVNTTYLVYLKDNAITVSENSLVPYAFLEAVKLKNFSLAANYLSAELKEQSTPAHLSKFFGEIKDIYYNSYALNKSEKNYTVFNGSYINYNFSVLNGKIADISETNLI